MLSKVESDSKLLNIIKSAEQLVAFRVSRVELYLLEEFPGRQRAYNGHSLRLDEVAAEGTHSFHFVFERARVVKVFLLAELLELVVKYLCLRAVTLDRQVVVVPLSDEVLELLQHA